MPLSRLAAAAALASAILSGCALFTRSDQPPPRIAWGAYSMAELGTSWKSFGPHLMVDPALLRANAKARDEGLSRNFEQLVARQSSKPTGAEAPEAVEPPADRLVLRMAMTLDSWPRVAASKERPPV